MFSAAGQQYFPSLQTDEDGGLHQLLPEWDECPGDRVPETGPERGDKHTEDTAEWSETMQCTVHQGSV